MPVLFTHVLGGFHDIFPSNKESLYMCKKGVISFAFLPAIHQSSIADMGSNHIVVQ